MLELLDLVHQRVLNKMNQVKVYETMQYPDLRIMYEEKLVRLFGDRVDKNRLPEDTSHFQLAFNTVLLDLRLNRIEGARRLKAGLEAMKV